jgi:glycosyltransferase involved in cell wall biosynthesis
VKDMRKTNVAFFSDILIEGFDGALRTMFHIINPIPKDRYAYRFICGEGPIENFDFQVLGIPRITIPFNKSYSLAMPALGYFKIKKALEMFRPDVIHIASPSLLGRYAIEYASSRNIPLVTIYHTHYISYVDYYLKRTPLLADVVKSCMVSGQRNFYNKCSLMLIPTKEIKTELVELGFDELKMKLWRRGIDHNIFNSQKKNLCLMKEYTGNRNFNILFASRLVWEKNLETLVRIYKIFETKNENINFIIAGDGIARDDLQKMMPKAIFTGKIDQDKLSILYASSDVFVFPSVSETYGSVVVESMASGCPPIVARGGGSMNLVDHGINGFLCDPYNEFDYYEKIMMIRNQKTLRKSMIKEGLKFTKGLNWEILVQEYFSIIDEYAQKVNFL